MKKIYITNGSGASGKDTFAAMLSNYVSLYKYSSVDLIKAMLRFVGIDDTQKDEDYRLLCSDMKDRLTRYGDIPFKDISEVVDNFKRCVIEADVLFIDIREPEEIKRAVDVFNAETILIRNPNVKKIESNHADKNVENYTYDYIIENNGSLEQLDTVSKIFSEKIMCSDSCKDSDQPIVFTCSDY